MNKILYNKVNSIFLIIILEMASTISDTKNPFLKDYSTSSILKKNYDVLLINSQVK